MKITLISFECFRNVLYNINFEPTGSCHLTIKPKAHRINKGKHNFTYITDKLTNNRRENKQKVTRE